MDWLLWHWFFTVGGEDTCNVISELNRNILAIVTFGRIQSFEQKLLAMTWKIPYADLAVKKTAVSVCLTVVILRCVNVLCPSWVVSIIS